MKRIFYILLLIGPICISSFAQQKQLTLEQAVLRQRSEFGPKTISNFEWKIGSSTYTYIESDKLLEVDPTNGKSGEILNLNEFNSVLKTSGLPEIKRLSGRWISKDILQVFSMPYFVFYNSASKQVVRRLKVIDNSANWDISPDNSKLAYTINNNLYLIDDKDNITNITNDNNTGIVNGQSVHRNEFGITKGIFWSPKSNLIAYYRMDETMVTDYPLVDITQRIGTLENIKYPMAGMKSHEVTLNVYSVITGKTITIKTGEPREQYLTNIAWSPDEQFIYIAVLNREQNHMKLNQYSAATGDFVATLFEEMDNEYVEPQKPIVFMPQDPSMFIWESRRDGWNHLYLYKTNGELVKQLTKGQWEVNDIVGVDAKKGLVYIT